MGTWRSIVRPILILLAVYATVAYIPTFLFPPGPADLERNSDRLGWSPASESDHVARDIFERVNDERIARGLRPLQWHDGLAERARVWSQEMIATGYRHSDAAFRMTAGILGTSENIAMGQQDSAEVHVGWMRSDRHRQNLLNPDLSVMGVGVVCRNDGRMWATQIFGVTDATGVPGVPPMPPVEPIVRRDPGTPCIDPGPLILR